MKIEWDGNVATVYYLDGEEKWVKTKWLLTEYKTDEKTLENYGGSHSYYVNKTEWMLQSREGAEIRHFTSEAAAKAFLED